MEHVNEITHIIALTMGAAWAAGINLYAAIATLGILSVTGNMTLPPDLQVLANPIVIGAACLMFAVEFIADKMPGVDTGWDTIHTFIRIPAGALSGSRGRGRAESCGQSGCRTLRRYPGRRHPRHEGRLPAADQHLARTLHQLDCIHRGGHHGDRRYLGGGQPSLAVFRPDCHIPPADDLAAAQIVARHQNACRQDGRALFLPRQAPPPLN
jgi:hypothetical protein